jgi:hypothetical protein
MRNRRRVISIGILAVLVIAAGVGVFAATSGGRSASTGNTQACSAFWSWHNQTGSATPVLTAYKEATTEPLIDDLREVSEGLKDLAREANQDQTAAQALTQSSALSAEADCIQAR